MSKCIQGNKNNKISKKFFVSCFAALAFIANYLLPGVTLAEDLAVSPGQEAAGFGSLQAACSLVGRTEEVNLKGIVSKYVGPEPGQIVDQIVHSVLEADSNHKQLIKKDKEYNRSVSKIYTSLKLIAQEITEYRGFEVSSEGAEVALDEKIRLKSSAAIDYAQQKQLDEVHSKVYLSLLQIAQGLGTRDAEKKSKIIEDGLSLIRTLVGDDEAQRVLDMMTVWADQIHIPEVIVKKDSWNIMEIQKKKEELVKNAIKADAVMGYTRRVLHKYNSHSNLALTGAKIFDVTTSIAMFNPTIVSPASQVAFLAYLMVTGGSEESKLLKELYLDKRIECRWRRINQETELALNGYNNAMMMRNPVLLAFSESLLSSLAGEEAVSNIVGNKCMVIRKSTHNDEISCVQTHNAM